MGFIPDLTCRHCGKKFSAIHSRCPHCGAKKVKDPGTLPPKTAQPGAAQQPAAPAASQRPARSGSGSGAASLFNSNTRWQFLFGCVLILLVIVAVIVLISTSIKGAKKPVESPPSPTVEVTAPPPTTTPPTPSPTPTIAVSSITISFLGEPKKEFTQRVEWAPIQLKADVYPTEALAYAAVEWRSSDEAVISVEDGLVTAVGPGVAEVIAECGGVAASCRVVVP